MYSVVVAIFVEFLSLCLAKSPDCNIACPPETIQCALNIKENTYKLFSSKCAMAAYSSCHEVEFVQTPIKYCIMYQESARRMYEESCPVFCPNHYRPVCGASKWRSYKYRTFTNGCFLDMLNCRGDEDYSAYVEVPLEFCQRHLMKNIFNEQVVVSNLRDYQDYQ